MFTSVSEFFTTVAGDIVIGVVCFGLGMAFKTKVTDWFKGVPSDVRTALTSVEANAVAKIKAAKVVAPVVSKTASPAAAALVAQAAASVAGSSPAPAAVAAAPAAAAAIGAGAPSGPAVTG